MADYTQLIPVVLRYEGGISRDSRDKALNNPITRAFFDEYGYHTNRGVVWATFAGLAAKAGYTATEPLFRAMPQDIWARIFKRGFWDVVLGDNIQSQAVANQLADFAWGSGPFNAVTALQRVLNQQFGKSLVVDGGMGPITLAAVNSVPGDALAQALKDARIAFLKSLSDSTWAMKGWIARVEAVYALAKKKPGGLQGSASQSAPGGSSLKGGKNEG